MTAAAGQSTDFALGRIEGQMREMIHTMNNLSQKTDALVIAVTEMKGLPADVAALDARVTALEADRNRRDGAMGFGGWILRSPLLGWLATAAAFVWAYLKGRG